MFTDAIRFAIGEIKPHLSFRGGSRPGIVLPDFLGIGAQKAGSTWLYENLQCHPELYLPAKKELHYFSRDLHKSLRSYSAYFTAGAGKVKGEITPEYGIISPRRIRYIRSLMPDVRLIFIMRNPVERAWSHAVMNLVTRANRRIEEVSDREFRDHFTSAASRKRADYLLILQNWSAVFRREQIFIGFFEDITRRPKEFLADVFCHLRVSRDVQWDQLPYRRVIRPRVGTTARREGPTPAMPERHRNFLTQLYRTPIEQLYQRFGQPVAEWRRQPVERAA